MSEHPHQHERRGPHEHGHSHDHAGHSHGISADADRGRLTLALGLILAFMAVEVTVGILSHSLALLSDAAHMLTDAAALAMSLVVIRIAARPARGAMTFGFKRAEVLSAQANGATLLVLGLLIVYEGIHRLLSPPAVTGSAVVVVAVVGIIVNLVATWTLSKANRASMNIEGSFQHLLTDLAGFILTAIAGGLILATGFDRADGIASLAIAAIMLHAAYSLLRASGRVLLEAAPEDLGVQRIGRAIAEQAEVSGVHDLPVLLSTSSPALSAHVLVAEDADYHQIRRDLERLIAEQFAIEHTTLQVDHEHERLISIRPAGERISTVG